MRTSRHLLQALEPAQEQEVALLEVELRLVELALAHLASAVTLEGKPLEPLPCSYHLLRWPC